MNSNSKDFLAGLTEPSPTAFVTSQSLGFGGAAVTELVFNNANYKPMDGDVALYTLDQARRLLGFGMEVYASTANHLAEEPTDLSKVDDWNATNRQIAVVMATTGTPEQQKAARQYFLRNRVSSLEWFRSVVEGTEYRD